MKKSCKKLLALLLTAVMILGLVPASAFAKEKGEQDSRTAGTEKMASGYIPAEIHGASAVSNAYKNGDMETYYRLLGKMPTRDTLPEKYDSRDYGLVTSMKNQNPYGSCWAHAAVASIESYMIKYGIPVGNGSAATLDLDLSETQHCWFNYTYAYDAEGMTTGDRSIPVDTCLDQGGNGEMSAYTLMRWTGAADETVPALQYGRASTVDSSGLDSQYAYEYDVCHVQNSEWIPGTSVDAIKRAIMKYGAGNISYYESGRAYSYICTIDNTSQDSASHKWANHAITVVGWDDTIAASRFSPNRPSQPGAWICKNSWGVNQFDNGYCYISYEDTSVGEGYIFFYDAEPVDNYDHNYQYDGSCNAVCYGKGWPSGSSYYVGFANDTKVANVFTSNRAETIEAVAFCNWDEAMTYTVSIYRNPSAGDPESGTLETSQDGYLTFSGYYTIPLEEPVQLTPGDTFSVVITQNVEIPDDRGYYVHTPYDATFSNSSVVTWCSWVHTNHGDTSFYKEPGGSWTGCADNGDFRIKAFTNDVEYAVTAIANNDAWGSLSVDGTVITASPAEGYYVSDYEVVEGTATAEIYRNVIRVTPSSDCTIRIIFASKPSYTVNFVAMGSLYGSQTAMIYDEITLPAGLPAPEGWTFTGWTAAELPGETADKPAFYEPGAAYAVTGNATLYALYSRTEGSGAVSYRLVTSMPADWTGRYVITRKNDSSLYMMKGVTVSSNGTEIENSSNAGSLSASGAVLQDDVLSGVPENYVFEMENRDSYYSVRSVSTGTYLGVTSSSYLGGYKDYTAGYCDWTPGPGDYVTSMRVAVSGNYPYVGFSSSGNYFWTTRYLEYSLNPIHFWKEEVDITTFYDTNPGGGAHIHSLSHTAAAAPGCEEPGHIEYWYCAGCGKYFSDAEGEHEITLADTVIPATGHAWGAPEWAWTETADGFTAVATFTCGNNAEHVRPVTANVTCEEDASGNLIYTAAVTGPDNKPYSDTNTVIRYTVEFVDEDGTVLQSRKYKAGELPVYEGEDPVKEDVEFHMYSFKGWDKEIVAVTGNETYTAVYDDVLYAQITGMSLALEGKLGIIFWMKAPEEAATAVISFNGNEVTYELDRDSSIFKPGSEQFRMPYSNVALKEVMDAATIRVYDADGEQLALVHNSKGLLKNGEWSFRVADWAYTILETSDSINSIGMAKALLNLGNAAQNYFDYNTENPANPDAYLREETNAVVPDAALDPVIPSGAQDKLGYKYVRLNLEGDTEIRICFDREVTAKKGSKKLEVIQKGDEWYVSVPGIAGIDLDVMNAIKVTYAGKSLTFKYGVLSFANRVMATSSDETFLYLAKALYLYNEAAEIYFNKVD
ncbi:MAG: InlB B-repeat-containing protein [Lachnospiraceae bacterium]|nr:InlB B-repeat-containing protein [Lachnospiraceae bacterium]